MEKRDYKIPGVCGIYPLEMEEAILHGSAVDDAFNSGGMKTMGQPVENKDFSSAELFNHQWE